MGLISLLPDQLPLFVLIVTALVISLTFHEFGHAYMAKRYGDDTAERMGRLTLNPMAHIDPMGLLMVLVVGFGYAKPVPTDPRNYTSRYADLLVSAAGPFMNLLVAFVTVNLYLIGLKLGWDAFASPAARVFFLYLAQINLLLMIFNLIPLGALDGHYILPYFLPRPLAQRYRYYNARYGNYLLLGLIFLGIMGVPIFRVVFSWSQALLPYIAVI